MIVYTILIVNTLIVTLLVVFGKKVCRPNELAYRQTLVIFSITLLIALANALSIGPLSQASNVSNRDIIILADISNSMNAIDGRKGNESTRLEDMREDIIKIATDNQGAAIAIHETGYSNYLASPLTTNLEHTTEAAQVINPPHTNSPLKNKTSYKEAYEYIGEYLRKQHESDPTRERILITMSDFEIYKDQESQDEIKNAYKSLAKYAGGFVNIVYGKDEGAFILKMSFNHTDGKYIPSHILYKDSSLGELKYIEEPYKNPVTSKPNLELADTLTQVNNGQLARYSSPDSYQTAIEKASKNANHKVASNPKSQAIRQNWLYSPLAILLFLWVIICEIIRPKWLKALLLKSWRKHEI